MAYTLLIWMTQLRGDAARALEMVAEGQAALDAIATDENADNIGFGHVDLLIAASGVHAALGDDRRCRAVAVEAVRLARQLRNLLALGVAIEIEAMWSWHDHPDETRHELEEAITILRHFGNISPLLLALALRGQIDVLAGRTQEGLAVLHEAVLGARDAGDRLSMITALDRTLPLAHVLGDAPATAVLGGVIDGTAFDPLSNVSARDSRRTVARARASTSRVAARRLRSRPRRRRRDVLRRHRAVRRRPVGPARRDGPGAAVVSARWRLDSGR